MVRFYIIIFYLLLYSKYYNNIHQLYLFVEINSENYKAGKHFLIYIISYSINEHRVTQNSNTDKIIILNFNNHTKYSLTYLSFKIDYWYYRFLFSDTTNSKIGFA